MYKYLSLLILILYSNTLTAQDKIPPNGVKVKEQHLYFVLDADNQISFFTEKLSNKQATGDETRFDIKGNTCNLYFKWLNPVRYRFTWTDTSFNDERDEAIKSFVSTLANLFGATNLNSVASKQAVSKAGPAGAAPVGTNGIVIPDGGFNSLDLSLLYIQLRANQNLLSAAEVNNLNNLTTILAELDKISTIPKELDQVFMNLYNIDDPDNIKTTIGMAKSDIQKFNTMLKKAAPLQEDASQQIADMTITDPLLNSYTKSAISGFLQSTQGQLSTNKKLVDDLASFADMITKSASDADDIRKDYFRNRSISFADGKVMQTSLTVDEYEYRSADKEFSKKGTVAKTRLIFRKYDPVGIFVSAGLFYSNTTLKGYGVATENDELIVTEDDINKNMAVTALFLNFNFGANSRYFAPIAQIGIDPTKKRPFLLAGVGFAIPSARFAISGGPIWTWNQSLDKLETGSVITSTTDLEKDIKYNIDIAPKGWYLGIQYNF